MQTSKNHIVIASRLLANSLRKLQFFWSGPPSKPRFFRLGTSTLRFIFMHWSWKFHCPHSGRKKRTADSNALRAGEDGDASVHPLWERSRVGCLCFSPNAARLSCLRQTYVLEHLSRLPIFPKVSRGTCRCWYGRHGTPHERN